MNFSKKSFFLTFAFFLAIACHSTPTPHFEPTTSNAKKLSSLEGSLRTKGGYDSYLALEYLTFARSLFSIKAEDDSEHFIKKGLAAANGEEVAPENPIARKADPAQIEEMVLMQKRLELVLDAPHIKFYLPIQTAHLSYLYDCWISRESKAVFRSDELAQCRTRFSKLLDEIEHFIDDQNKDKQPEVTITEPQFERFEILFDFGLFKFNDQANKDLLKVLQYLKTLQGDYRILVVGNADRVGLELSNQHLALNRADVVRNYLIKNGTPEDLVELRTVGEDYPDIITKDGTQQQSNRTAGIYILKGFRTFSSFPLPLIENEIYRKELKAARAERGLE